MTGKWNAVEKASH